jgi:N-acetyl-anhydromuramyl-L-alanine amidase AmpD
VKPDQLSSVAQIDSWHRDRGFKFGVGYHYVIRRDGTIEAGRPEWLVGAHCVNHNKYSIGVCYEGGLDARGQPADTRTAAQKATLRNLLTDLHRRYPRAVIVGHHDLNPQKECPCIKNVAEEYKDLQPH